MFSIYKSDAGNIQPWEYMEPATGATFAAGQLITVSGGKAAAVSSASTTAPEYLCMGPVNDDGLVPVSRITKDAIYETANSAANSGLAVGGKLKIAAGGLAVAALGSGETGCFEVVAFDGTAAGDNVIGRFV